MEDKVKVKYFLGGWNESKWEGSLDEAKRIALAEIHEHAGGSSAAYAFTKAVFNYYANKLILLKLKEGK